MAPTVKAMIKPELLVWARKSAGISLEQAAKRAQVTPARLEAWEQGESAPTIRQLRLLGQAYRRPLGFFYLPEPPKGFKAMSDFRRLPNEAEGPQSPQLRFEIRRAHERREVALELYEDLEEPPPGFEFRADIAEDPEALAGQIRELLRVTYEDQIAWRTPNEALKAWRSALEEVGVLTFQASGIEVKEMRGFSISDRPLPVIVINGRDRPRGRIFTLLHEFVHLLLDNGGLCSLREAVPVEIFCNRVAGAALVPAEYFIKEKIVTESGPKPEWTDEELDSLSRTYQVSSEVILRRLLTLGYTTEDFYRRKREEFQERYAESEAKSAGGRVPMHRRVISSAGTLYTRLILESYYREKITSGDVSELLGARLRFMGQIEREVIGYPVGFGAAP